jgi:hypothetical protein
MPKISEQTLAAIQWLANKANERSSLYGYLMLCGGAYAQSHQGVIAQAVAITSATAGFVSIALSDTTIKAWLTGQKVDVPTPTVPPNQAKQP